MFDNKLSNKQTYQLLSILQFVLGIIGYFTVKIKIQFLVIFTILGFIFLALSFLKPSNKAKAVKKRQTNPKYDQIMGLCLICVGLGKLIFVPHVGLALIFVDAGLTFMLTSANYEKLTSK